MKTNSQKDLELVEAIKSGNKAVADKAFGVLFNKYHPSILFHYKKLGNDDVLAEDLTMEAFEKMYEKIGKFNESEAAFSTWMFSLTKNLFIDMLRKRREEKVYLSEMSSCDEDGVVTTKEIASEDSNRHEDMEKEERNKRLMIIVNETFKKKTQLRELIELRFFCDMSYEEMAEITGRPVGTIKAHLHRAKGMLLEACTKAKLSF
jgi:RNA polymerase sigma-70 factor (ECF subfamily)